MQITKEYLLSEIDELEAESEKAKTFLAQTQAVISSYRMLINKLDEDEPSNAPSEARSENSDQ